MSAGAPASAHGDERVAIITGASQGLGLALSRALLARGWSVVADARDAAALGEAARGLPGLVPIAGDVTDPAHRAALVEAAGGAIDLVVNNASALGPSPRPLLAAHSIEDLRRIYDVNVLAPLGLIQAALPSLAEGATIVNVTSDASIEPYPGWGGYGSSKAALDQLTAILAAERPELRIYAVDPGDMRTQMQQAAFPGEDISDRPLPEESVPAFLALLAGARPSGRYRARDLAREAV
jgi:NAD(P)-dependent dehydrogenase (short-subunit alcohol dehydrogenase family)